MGRWDDLPEGPAAGTVGLSWQPVDMSTVGSVAAHADLLRRVDGAGLLYRGRTHWLQGESESGKTWVALVAAHQLLEAGGRVVFIDFEDHGESIKSRLLALGAKGADICDPERFAYLRPDEPTALGWCHLEETLTRHPTDLAIVDGVTEAMAGDGLDPNSNRDVAVWVAALPRKVTTTTGVAVLALDHVTKNRETRSGYAIGAQHKRAAIDGAAFDVETIGRLAPVFTGMEPTRASIVLRIAKDRGGYVRGHAEGGVAAVIDVTAWPDGGITYQVAARSTAVDFAIRERIAALLAGKPGATKTDVRGLGGARTTIDGAVTGMVLEGHVTVEQDGNRERHFLTEDGHAAYQKGGRP